MSGGVDSSVAAVLLREGDCEVFGLTARTRPSESRLCSDADVAQARRVADHVGIAHYAVDVSDAFEREVLRYFADEYAVGRTPTPCAVCNRAVKFGVLLREARAHGATHLATGHYAANLPGRDGYFHLHRGADPAKDQSYFLFALSQEQLRHVLFPLADMRKPQVRAFAAERGLPVVERPESQDLCFSRPGEHWRIVEHYRPDARKPGHVVTLDGKVLGRHEGLHRFTIGQRKGLGVAAGRRMYVAALRPATNEVVLAERDRLSGRRLTAGDVRWISGQAPPEPYRAAVQIRYNHRAAPARIVPAADGTAAVVFDEPQFAVTPGQAAVFYRGRELIGGGWIETLMSASGFQRPG